MKHRGFYNDYYSILLQECSLIEDYLKNVGGKYHFANAVELIAYQGSVVLVHDIELDKDDEIVFIVDAFMENGVEWSATDFAFGELDKILDELPEPRHDIMNTLNGHNTELVNKINSAWRQEQYYDAMRIMLYAMAYLYKDEYLERVSELLPMSYENIVGDIAHGILENVCDDEDLKVILSSIRYKE